MPLLVFGRGFHGTHEHIATHVGDALRCARSQHVFPDRWAQQASNLRVALGARGAMVAALRAHKLVSFSLWHVVLPHQPPLCAAWPVLSPSVGGAPMSPAASCKLSSFWLCPDHPSLFYPWLASTHDAEERTPTCPLRSCVLLPRPRLVRQRGSCRVLERMQTKNGVKVFGRIGGRYSSPRPQRHSRG